MEFQKTFIESIKKEHGASLKYDDYVQYYYKFGRLYRENDPKAPKSGFSTLSDYSDHINREFSKLLKENGVSIIRKNS